MTGSRDVTGHAGVTAIVLAGGRSARFGGPKLEALVDGRTVLDRALLAVDQVAASIVVAGPEPRSVPPLDALLRAVADATPFDGPLVALQGALRLTATELAIVVGGDMPALVPEVLRRLLERLRWDARVDAVVLEAPTASTVRPAVLPFVLRVNPASTAADEAIAAGDRSLARLLGRLSATTVPLAAWQPLDPAARTLLDIDVPADLDRLRGDEIR